MVKGEASFEQWSYELQILRKTYSEGRDSKITEGGCSRHSPQYGSWCLPGHHHKEILHHLWECVII